MKEKATAAVSTAAVEALNLAAQAVSTENAVGTVEAVNTGNSEGTPEIEDKKANEPVKKTSEEMVTFRLFKDNDKYKAPIFVGVNGTGYLVERGKEVTMPKFVYEVLKNSEEQLQEAARVMEEAEYVEH